MIRFFHNKPFNTALALILLPIILIMSLMIMAEPPRPFVVSEGWQYQYGDSSKNAQGIPLWVYDSKDNSSWIPFTCPGQPPGETDSGDIWLRTVLPTSEYKNPSIMFTTNDQLFEVYLEDKLIYNYGTVEHPNDKVAPGSPWHLIHLPEDYQGKMVYLRMHTPFVRNTGFVRRFEIGSENEHIAYLIASEIDNVLLVCLFTFLGFCLIFVYAIRKSVNYEFPALGLFSISIGTWLFAETSFKQLFFYAPRFWLYIAFLSFYLMPVGFLIFVERVFSPGNIYLKMMYRLHILFTAITLLLDISRLVPFIFTLQAYYVVLSLSIVTIFATITKAARAQSNDTRIFVWGLSIFTLFGVYDVLGMYFRIVPWSQYIIPYGMFIFMLSMIYILGRRFADVYDKLMVYSEDIKSKNEALHQAYQEVNESRDKLTEWNKGLAQTIQERTASVRNLLDNAGQGFLTFDADLAVASEFSSECYNIFNCDITGKSFPELVYPENVEERAFITALFERVLSEEDEDQRKIYLSLLPEEFSLDNKCFHMNYRIIKDKNVNTSEVFMVILTDITYKRMLEKKVEQEHNIFKMVVKVITNYDDFVENIKDYKEFCSHKLSKLLCSNQPIHEILYEIYRAIHTYKGTFCLFDMPNIIEKLHTFETELSHFKNCNDPSDINKLTEFILGNDIEGWLGADMYVIESILGDKFLNNKDTIVIRKDSLLSIEKKLLLLLPPSECKLLLPDIKKLRYKPLKEVLKGLPDCAQNLADRMNKLINPLEIQSEVILVDPDKYQGFSKALIHIFRNIIDHGLETAEERISSGKPERCNVKCEIKLVDNIINMTISDDGRGFDFNKIRQIIIDRELLSGEIACSLTDNEAVQLMIDNHISTKVDANYISGRGLGLSSIKEETERLGGTLTIIAERGKGTQFLFQLPYETGFELSGLSAASIINPVIDTAKNFLFERLKCDTSIFSKKSLIKLESILLKDYTCFICIKGIVTGRFVFTMDRRLAEKLLEHVVIGGLSVIEQETYIEDLLAESTNIIIGNSIKKFPRVEDLIVLEPPIAIKLSNAALKYINSPAWSYDIETEYGNMSISFIVPSDNSMIGDY